MPIGGSGESRAPEQARAPRSTTPRATVDSGMTGAQRPITNPKVAGLEPSWRRYAGLSVLFDNPGRPPRARGGVSRLADPLGDDAPLLVALAGLWPLLEAARLRDDYGLCPLPPHTYHVTVCDGVNEIQAPSIARKYAGEVRTVLDRLPESLAEIPDSLGFLADTEVRDAARGHPVTFRAAEVVGWGSALAVRLAPASHDDEASFAALTAVRDRLAAAIKRRLGIGVQPWRPHVSLAYFADRTGSAAAKAEIPQWSRMLLDVVGDSTVRFSSASLYGFTDMATFFAAA